MKGNRWRYLASAAAMAAGLIAIGYAFVVRDLGLNHGLKSPYAIAAAALVVISRRLTKHLPSEDRPRWLALAIAAVLGAAAGAGACLLADPPLALRGHVVHALPGFTVEVPAGGKESLSGHDYTTGMLMVELDKDAAVVVGWTPGDGSRQELETMARGAEGSLPVPIRSSHMATIAGHDTKVIELERGDTMYYTTVPCDGRSVFVDSLGVAESVHARVVRSIACKPEPHEPVVVPVVLDPHGLVPIDNPDGVVYGDGTGTALLAAGVLPATIDFSNTSVVISTLTSWGVVNPQIVTQTHDSVTYKGSWHGVDGTGTIRTVRCDRRIALVLSFAHDDALAATLHDAVMAAPCR